MTSSHFIIPLLFCAAQLAAGFLDCRPDGPVVPKPTSLAHSPTFQRAVSSLEKKLDAAVAGSIQAGWAVSNSSFSLAIVSADQEDGRIPLWEYHHLSRANDRGTRKLGRDSQYLVGSVSKVFTVYVLLASGIDLDASVAKFIPGINARESVIRWDEITLRMLASHVAGVPVNYGFSDAYFLKEVFQAYGFPALGDDAYPPCGVTGLNAGCTKQDFLDGIASVYPITAVGERPAYSNLAYLMLGLALEQYTGKNYSQLVNELLATPLDMQNTFPSPGDDDRAVIPPGSDNSWGADYGLNNPTGGLVSSISDLSKFAHALLSRTLNMTAGETRAWLKPSSLVGNAHSMVGMPWEIVHPANITPKHPHSVTIYGKSGGAQAYRSQLDIVDEYGVAAIVLTAGPMQAVPILRDSILAALVPAIDEVAREQASKYERSFTSSTSNSGGVPIKATFAQDQDSLLFTSLTRNGSDILTGLVEMWTLAMGAFTPPIGPTIRLFPSELSEKVTVGGKPVLREAWRLWPEVKPDAKTDLGGAGLEKMDCAPWMLGDWVHYGREPSDRVLFYLDGDGAVVGFEIPFLRSGILSPE